MRLHVKKGRLTSLSGLFLQGMVHYAVSVLWKPPTLWPVHLYQGDPSQLWSGQRAACQISKSLASMHCASHGVMLDKTLHFP